jgi:inorganic pyrophosphatase
VDFRAETDSMNKKTASAKKVTTPLETRSIEVVIEAPKGSRNKFRYDPVTRRFKLSKVLPEGMVFPYDFGFVPSTKGADGDPIRHLSARGRAYISRVLTGM